MSKSKLRNDKTCLNCRHVVEQKFCPNCGQENSDTRKTFHHLFVHFFEDLTHYENAFWKTLKNLIFKPGALTKEYLSGKRLSYLAPVRLYIFISFITFFLIAVLPKTEDGNDFDPTQKKKGQTSGQQTAQQINDSVAFKMKKLDGLVKTGLFSKTERENILKSIKENTKGEKKTGWELGYSSLDSLEQDYKAKEFGDNVYWFLKKVYYVEHNNTRTELGEKFNEAFQHNLPKVLFVYMPLFAFFLWIFHSKKRWYYFDHGIFTLHYFSFLLIMFLIIVLLERFMFLFGHNAFTETINDLFEFVGSVWIFYYFFPAHHRFYGESRTISLLKSVGLFFINTFFIILIFAAFLAYTFINLH